MPMSGCAAIRNGNCMAIGDSAGATQRNRCPGEEVAPDVLECEPRTREPPGRVSRSRLVAWRDDVADGLVGAVGGIELVAATDEVFEFCF